MHLHFNLTHALRPKLTEEDWGNTEWLVDDNLVPEAGMSVGVMTILAGKKSPKHAHSNCHELIFLVEGKVEVALEKERIILNAGDSVLCPAGTSHGFKNVGDGAAKMVISYSAGKRKYESIS
jgi:quercetin dioxygenase-like cupin family protein